MAAPRPSIHVVTVHWRSDRWIEPQLRAFERHLSRPYRTYAGLGAMPRKRILELRGSFDLGLRMPYRSHPEKLNALADVVALDARPDDVIVFVDGDAFPVASLEPLIDSLDEHRLIAVRRDENGGDPQPHPCFCMTTAATWRELEGDWRKGPRWTTPAGRSRTDVGARLMAALDAAAIPWRPLTRSNRRELHPLMFGVYGDVVYHHGGGFRRISGGQSWRESERARRLRGRPTARLASMLPRRGRWLGLRRRLSPVERYGRQLALELSTAGEEVHELILRNPDFARQLIDPRPGDEIERIEVPSLE